MHEKWEPLNFQISVLFCVLGLLSKHYLSTLFLCRLFAHAVWSSTHSSLWFVFFLNSKFCGKKTNCVKLQMIVHTCTNYLWCVELGHNSSVSITHVTWSVLRNYELSSWSCEIGMGQNQVPEQIVFLNATMWSQIDFLLFIKLLLAFHDRWINFGALITSCL